MSDFSQLIYIIDYSYINSMSFILLILNIRSATFATLEWLSRLRLFGQIE